MMSVEEFRTKVRANELEALLDEVLLADEALHVSIPDIRKINSALRAMYTVPADKIYVRVVGSAKLGFSIVEKTLKDGQVLPRYRSFSAASDIDILVICPEIFDFVWNDLSSHAHKSARLPWNSGPLGDYLVCGWLRPDHFPRGVGLRRCDDWSEVFRKLSKDRTFRHRKVSGGLFHSVQHARRYLMRALKDCARAEALEA
jgi:hypothetical protein